MSTVAQANLSGLPAPHSLTWGQAKDRTVEDNNDEFSGYIGLGDIEREQLRKLRLKGLPSVCDPGSYESRYGVQERLDIIEERLDIYLSDKADAVHDAPRPEIPQMAEAGATPEPTSPEANTPSS